MLNPSRPMGHAFVLKGMLERGANILPADFLNDTSTPPALSQLDLF